MEAGVPRRVYDLNVHHLSISAVDGSELTQAIHNLCSPPRVTHHTPKRALPEQVPELEALELRRRAEHRRGHGPEQAEGLFRGAPPGARGIDSHEVEPLVKKVWGVEV